MKIIFFIIPLLLILSFSLIPIYAEVQLNEKPLPKILDSNNIEHNFIFTDNMNNLQVETMFSSVSLNKSTCTFSFYNEGRLINQPTLFYNDSIIPYNKIVNSTNWNEITTLKNANCITSWDDTTLTAQHYVSNIGIISYKYKWTGKDWKTSLEATNLSTLTNRVFGFDQIINLNSDFIKWNDNTINLNNFNGTTFDRNWLNVNYGNVINLMDKYNFNFDLGYDYLESVTVYDTGQNMSQLVFHYKNNNSVLLPNQKFVIDPTITKDGAVVTKTGTTATSDSTSITVGSNSNRILIIAFSEYGSSAGATTVKVGGVDAVKAKSYHLGGNGGGYAEIWYFIAPSTGSQTVAITKTAGTSYGFGIYSLYGVNQTSPIGATAQLGNSASGTPQPNGTITPTTVGSWIIDSIQSVSAGTTPTASLTSGFSVTSSGNIYESSQYKTNPTIGSSNSMAWSNLSGAGYWWDWVAVEIRELKCTPNAPTSPTAESNSTSIINLSWVAPTNCSSPNLTQIFQSPDGSTSWTSIYNSTTKLTHAATGLAGNNDYFYKIRYQSNSTSGYLWGANSTAVSDYTTPYAPTTLGTTIISTTQINLSWTAPNGTGTLSYKIERESPVGAGFSTLVNNTGSATTTYNNTSISSGTQYNYRVSAWNSDSVSSPSNTSAKFTPNDAPTSLIATGISASQINLSWTAPSGTVTGYKIERESPVGGGWSVLVADTGTSTTSYSNTGLTTNTQYNYRVSAINSGGTSASSTAANAKTFGVADPPTSLAVNTISTSQINLSWVAPIWTGGYSIQGYKIQRESPTGGGFTTLVNNTGLVLSYSNTGLTSGTQYNYKLTTWNSQGSSAETSAVANYTKTNAPTSLTATATTGTNINLSWTAPSGTVTGYKIERESPIGGGFSTLVANTGTTATTYSNSGLTQLTQYNYRVSAINLGGTSAVSNEDDATTFNYPSPPLNLIASTSTPTSITLSWTIPSNVGGSNVTGYKIERESPTGGGFGTIVNNTGTTSTGYTNSPLSSGTQYNYRVSAWNAAGSSSPSNEDDATTFVNIVGTSTFTKEVVGDSMKVTHTAIISAGDPTPTITSLRLYKDNSLVNSITVSQVISAGGNHTFDPYWYRITDTSTHSFYVQAVTSQWNGTKLLSSATQSSSQEYNPDYFTSDEGSIQVNYTTTRFDEGSGLQIKINRAVISPTWNIECKVKSVLFTDGTWLNKSGVGYYNETTTVSKSKNAYITCYNDQLLFTTTSFGINNATTSLVDFTSQLGSFFGVPLPFLFVIFLGGIFTGRSAPVGGIMIAGTIGTMGLMGFLPALDGSTDNAISVAVFGMIILLAALSIFMGKRYY